MPNSLELSECLAEARNQAFSAPLLDRYSFEFVTEEKLWTFYIPELFAYHPRDLFFMKDELVHDDALKRIELLKKANQAAFNIQENILIREKETGNVVALFHGWQKDYDSYCMQVSAVHRDYRRKGIYSTLIDRIIHYTKLLGFNTVVSYHAPSNNAVLIAKLKKNFKITTLEIDGQLGINLWLCYFHNTEMQRAYEFRCGQIDFSRELFRASEGTGDELLKVLEESSK